MLEQKQCKDQNGKIMKIFFKTLSFACLILILGSCSNKNDMDNLIISKWEKCSSKDNCIIDFSTSTNFEWDKMFYFSSAFSLEEVNERLGTELKSFTDIGDRLVFMNDNKIVYHQEWFYDPSKKPKGIVFSTDDNFLEVSKEKAKFKIKKNEALYYLELLR